VETRETPRWLRRVLQGAAGLCLLALFTSVPAAAAPKLTVPKSEVSIGVVTAGESVEVDFPIENTGTEPLQITKVGTSCGCTTTSYPETLAPGEKGVLKARLTSNPLWKGRVQKEITVVCNDPDQSTHTLHLVAEMQPLFQFSPSNPLVVQYKKGDVYRQVVTISAASDISVKVVGVTGTVAEAEARILPAEASDPPGTTRVEVTVHPPQQGGDFSEHLTLQTSHPKVPTVPLVISLQSQDTITVQPRAIYWSDLSAGNASTDPYLLVLTKRSGRFRILKAEAEHSALQVQIPSAGAGATESLGEESFHEVLVRYTGGLPAGTTRGKLRITTNDANSPLLEVPYELTIP
jgi:hypothetical protein